MDHCILFRNTSNGRIGFVSEGDDSDVIAVYPDLDAAVEASENVPILRAYPFQIVCLDEL